MKRLFLAVTLSLTALPVAADELTDPSLLSEISGKHYDCKMGETSLEWIVTEIAEGAETIAYSAVVHGKTVEAEYTLSEAGRLSSDGYGDERIVTQQDDGALHVARADGRVMVCAER